MKKFSILLLMIVGLIDFEYINAQLYRASCDDPGIPNKKSNCFSRLVEDSDGEHNNIEDIVTDPNFISFVVKDDLKDLSDERIIEAMNFVGEHLYESESRNETSASIILIKEYFKQIKGTKFSFFIEKNVLESRDPDQSIDKELFSKNIYDLFLDKIFVVLNSGIYENESKERYLHGIYRIKFEEKNPLQAKQSLNQLEKMTIIPLGYFGFQGRTYSPVDEKGNPILKNNIEQSNYNRYQKIKFDSSDGLSGGSLNIGFAGGGLDYFKLTGCDEKGEAMDAIDIVFTNFGLEFGVNIVDYFIKKKNIIPEENVILNKFYKYWCETVTADVSLPGFPFFPENIVNLNFPMELSDFYGYGYIASFTVGITTISYINFSLSENPLHQNKTFEATVIGNGLKLDLCTGVLKNIGLKANIKYGFFQPYN